MRVSSLEVENFRNLHHIRLQCSPRLNLVVGENASGKTSVLEALYFLSRVRSFRTRNVEELIQNGQDSLRVVAVMSEPASGRQISLGIQRSAGEMSARISGTPVRSLAQLTIHAPVLLLNTDSHSLLEDGPQQRRRFLDWGLFHTEPAFMPAWKRYNTALRHRNAALRANAAGRILDAWDEELASTGEPLDQARAGFCMLLGEALAPLAGGIMEDAAGVEVEYRCGWWAEQRERQDLLTVLHDNRDQDRRNGYTRLGPHRADFAVRVNGQTAPAYLSRGQQKLLVIALILAQAHLYQTRNGTSCILLIDDLPAELDRSHRERVMRCLTDIESQLFITAIEVNLLNTEAWPSVCVFNMRRGGIDE